MKKLIFGAVLSIGLLVSPAFTQAAGLTTVQINAILSLLSSFGADSSVISNVQASLTGNAPTTGGQSFCHTFNTDLTTGTSNDVADLRQALSLSGTPLVYTYRNDDTDFNQSDVTAVMKFQAKYSIRQTGYVGPMTRAKLNSLYRCSNQPAQQPFITILSPNGGEQYSQGQTIPISFSTNLTDQQDPNGFNIVVYGGGSSTNIGSYNYVQNIVTRWIGGSPYNWSIPSSLPAGNYTVYIVPDQLASGVSNVGLFDFSNNYFTIAQTATPTAPTITSLSPSSGPVGTAVRVCASGFDSSSGVYFNGDRVAMASSPGTTGDSCVYIVFPVPSMSHGSCGYQNCAAPWGPTVPGVYNVQVSNANGTSDWLPFTVSPSAPTITNVQSLNGNITISGHFTVPSKVSLNGQTLVKYPFGVAVGDVINFNVSDFGITASGSYPVQIIDFSLGNSNIVYLNYTAPAPTSLTSTQIQSVQSILSSFGATSAAITNMNTILYGGTVSATGLAPSGLTSSQVQSVASLLSSFGANAIMIANTNIVLGVS